MQYIDAQTAYNLFSYSELVEQLLLAHLKPTEIIDDLLLDLHQNQIKNQFYLRAAWQKNRYLGCKNTTVFPQNRNPKGPPSIQGLYTLFDGINGSALCCIDGAALTHIKTATDSALGAYLLAKEDAKTMLMIGAGAMASHLIEAHSAVRPSIEKVFIWNRTFERCQSVADALKRKNIHIDIVQDLHSMMQLADLICSAVTTSEPYIKGKLLKPGCHLDLVGSYTEQLREADNEAIRRSSVFVDSRRTTVNKVGDIYLPIQQGVMSENDIKGDFYDAASTQQFRRCSDQEITLFKNGGGGHLDLMVATLLFNKFMSSKADENT